MLGSDKNAGNAMVEFLLVAGVLVPICLWIPKLGKLAELDQSGVQAARYALWERTISDTQEKPDEVLLEEVKARIMQKSAALIATVDAAAATQAAASISYATLGETALISAGPNAMLLVTQSNQLSGAEGAQAFIDAIGTVGNALDSWISGASWDVEQGGLVTVDFSMAITTPESSARDCTLAPADSPCWTRGHTMFMDGWYAESPARAASRSKSFVPAGVLEPVGDALSYLGAVPLFEEMKKLKGSFGTVDPDVLPLDRYGEQ